MGLWASSTIPEAGRQNPESDKTQLSSASKDSTQLDELEGVMSLETALVRALRPVRGIWWPSENRRAFGGQPAATFTRSVRVRAGVALNLMERKGPKMPLSFVVLSRP